MMLSVSAILVCVTIALLSWLSILVYRNRRFWTDRGVPHNKPHWLLGSLTFFFKNNPNRWLISLCREFKTPYVGVWVMWKPALIVQSPELVRRILVKDSDIFRDRYVTSGSSDPIGSLNIFAAKDPLWTSVRRRLTVVFTASRLRALQGLINTKSQELVKRLRQEMNSKNQTDIRYIYTDFTTDIIGTATFGINCIATLQGDCPMRRITKDFQTFSYVRAAGWGSIFFFPQIVDIFRFSLFPKETVNYLRKVWQAVVQQRGGYDKALTEIKDLVDALIKLRQEAAEEGQEISEDLLIAQAAVFLQGGFETSASNLTFLTVELAHEPHIQDKLYEEILEAKKIAGDKELDMTIYNEMPYLNAVIKETLRKYTAMGWFDRVASQDYKIDEKLTVPAGTPVWVNGIGMHYNPDIHPDPDRFDPERFMPENEKNIQPYTYMPFGEGPRACIGKRFALMSMYSAVSSIFFNFKVKPKSGCKKPNDVKWCTRHLFIVPGEDVPLEFISRN